MPTTLHDDDDRSPDDHAIFIAIPDRFHLKESMLTSQDSWPQENLSIYETGHGVLWWGKFFLRNRRGPEVFTTVAWISSKVDVYVL